MTMFKAYWSWTLAGSGSGTIAMEFPEKKSIIRAFKLENFRAWEFRSLGAKYLQSPIPQAPMLICSKALKLPARKLKNCKCKAQKLSSSKAPKL